MSIVVFVSINVILSGSVPIVDIVTLHKPNGIVVSYYDKASSTQIVISGTWEQSFVKYPPAYIDSKKILTFYYVDSTVNLTEASLHE